jgi:hypothetical protein
MDYLATGVGLLLIMIVFALAQWLPLHDASICQAIKEGKKRFVFEGQEIRLIPRLAILPSCELSLFALDVVAL